SKIVTASEDGTAKLWDGRAYVLLGTLEGHSGKVFHAELSDDGALIATAGNDRSVKVWDAGSRRLLLSFEQHAGPGTYAVFSRGAGYLASASRDGAAMLWELSREARPERALARIERCLPLRVRQGDILPTPVPADCL